MHPWHLSRSDWDQLKHLLHRGHGDVERSKLRTDEEAAAKACIYRFFHSSAPSSRSFGWNELPERFGVSPSTANRRFREWSDNGSWSRFWLAFLRLRADSLAVGKVKSPVQATVAELERAYSFFNVQLFGNALPSEVMITVEHFMLKNRWGMFQGIGETGRIGIASRSLQNRTAAETLGTLIHEMVHFRNHLHGLPDTDKNGRYHNRHFRDTAATAGLTCVHA